MPWHAKTLHDQHYGCDTPPTRNQRPSTHPVNSTLRASRHHLTNTPPTPLPPLQIFGIDDDRIYFILPVLVAVNVLFNSWAQDQDNEDFFDSLPPPPK